MGRNPRANNMGVLNLMEPPQSEMKNADRMMIEGMEIIMVVV
tara:strand:+ start:974 stop:1099 length:126 start_codon:yes stop_codon:yes gene_type:complete